MPLEIKLICNRCNTPQIVTIAVTATAQVTCPHCGAAMLEVRNIPGYIYILSNPSAPGLLKIGITARSVADRVAELGAATGVPTAFKIEAYFESSDPVAQESSVHSYLDDVRVKGKEFFRVSVDDAIKAVQKATGSVPVVDSPQSYADRWAQKSREEAERIASMPRFRCAFCLTTFSSANNSCPKCQRAAPRLWR